MRNAPESGPTTHRNIQEKSDHRNKRQKGGLDDENYAQSRAKGEERI